LEFGGIESIIFNRSPGSFIFFEIEKISDFIFSISLSKNFSAFKCGEKSFWFTSLDFITFSRNNFSLACIILNLREESFESANGLIEKPLGLMAEK